MNQYARHSQILDILSVEQTSSIGALAQRFSVSEETIRRDIRQLEDTGRVSKIHGGVTIGQTAEIFPYQARINENAPLKRRIGERATGIVEDGMTLVIDSGSTSYWLAKALLRRKRLTIVTNDIEVARCLSGGPQFKVYFAGGELSPDLYSTFGLETQAFMSMFNPDITFFCIGGIDRVRGFMDHELAEVQLKRALTPSAQRIIVLADSTKFGRRAHIQALDFGTVHGLITDEVPLEAFRKGLNNVEVLVAD